MMCLFIIIILLSLVMLFSLIFNRVIVFDKIEFVIVEKEESLIF